MRTRVLAEVFIYAYRGKPSVIEIELRADRDKILHRNNAQGILQALATLEERRAEFTTRWLWELKTASDALEDSVLDAAVFHLPSLPLKRAVSLVQARSSPCFRAAAR
jgi:hypothetical protein